MRIYQKKGWLYLSGLLLVMVAVVFAWLAKVNNRPAQARELCPGVICDTPLDCEGTLYNDKVDGNPYPDACCDGICMGSPNSTDNVEFCAGTSETVTPGQNDVSIEYCTNPTAVCRTELYDGDTFVASQSDEHDLSMHLHYFDGLLSEHNYSYKIICNGNNDAQIPLAEGDFTTLKVDNLVISNISVQPGTYTVVFNWQTNKPATSRVYIAGVERASDSNLVTQHSLTVNALSPQTTYHYSLMSGTDTTVSCSPETSSQTCAATTNNNDSFTTLNAETSPDANVVLKVDRDRVCNKWLYCNAGVQVLNTAKNPPTKEDVCFSVGLCGEMDAGGQCAKILDSTQDTNLTYRQPEEVEQIKNLTGYSRVGLDWGKRCLNNGLPCQTNSDCGDVKNAKCVEAKVEGFYPYSMMKEIGISMGLENYNFSDGTTLPWHPHRFGRLFNVFDDNNQSNRILKVVPNKDEFYSGIETTVTDNIKDDGVYVFSFLAKTDNANGQEIKVKLHPTNSNLWLPFKYYDSESNTWKVTIELTNEWREYVLRLKMSDYFDSRPSGGWGSFLLSIFQESPGDKGNFYLDNVSMKSVLKVNDPNDYIQRSCRMYPDKNALACDYYNEQKGKEMKGWKGYCVEPDPGYSDQRYAGHPVCLQWWPVDVINGEANIFSNDPLVGYSGRKPLYYCLQARGEYPYVKTVAKAWSSGNVSHCSGDKIIDVSKYNIYKDEIAEIKIEGVRIDHDNAGFGTDDCGTEKVWTNDIEHNPAKENKIKGGAGEIIFNEVNKQFWNYKYDAVMDTGNGYTVEYNKYANLRCWGSWDGSNHDVSTAYLEFNNYNKLIAIHYKHCDGSPGNGAGRFNDIKIILKGEICSKIVEVVKPNGENKAWATRIKPGGWTQNNYLGYSYDQDYAPYGASVVTGLDFDPTKLDRPLYVEMPNKSSFMQEPYQVRAGTPYSLNKSGICVGDSAVVGISCENTQDCLNAVPNSATCEGGGGGSCMPDKDGVTCNGTCETGCGVDCSCVDVQGYCSYDENVGCTTDADCRIDNPDNVHCELVDSVIGTQCVAGSDSEIGKECEDSSDCGPNGVCAGIKLTRAQKEALAQKQDPVEILSQLFVKSYAGWTWDWAANDGHGGYIVDNSFIWDRSGDYGTPPKVNDILINDAKDVDVSVIGSGAVVLKFTSWVEPDQVPLAAYTVDWGDGTITSENGLSIAPKSNIENPHILVHYYKFDKNCPTAVRDASGNLLYCAYQPKVSIKDNWGIEGQKSFSQTVRVYPPGTAEISGTLEVSPTELNYDSANGLPQTQNFIVTNSSQISGQPLEWQIEPETAEDKYFRDSNNNTVPQIKYSFVSPYTFGYQGSLSAGQISQVGFTVDDIGSANTGTYYKIIKISSLDGSQKEQVKIILQINSQ